MNQLLMFGSVIIVLLLIVGLSLVGLIVYIVRQGEGAAVDKDCCRCWCDTCVKLDKCRLGRRDINTSSLAPIPCQGCRSGDRFRPIEKVMCPGYESVQ